MSKSSDLTMKQLDRTIMVEPHPDESSTTTAEASKNNKQPLDPTATPSKLSSKRAFFENAFKKQKSSDTVAKPEAPLSRPKSQQNEAFAKNRLAVAQVLQQKQGAADGGTSPVPFMTTKEAKQQQSQKQNQKQNQKQQDESRTEQSPTERTETSSRGTPNAESSRQNLLSAIQAHVEKHQASETPSTTTTATNSTPSKPVAERPMSAPPTTNHAQYARSQESPRFSELQSMWGSKMKSTNNSKTNPRAPWKLTIAEEDEKKENDTETPSKSPKQWQASSTKSSVMKTEEPATVDSEESGMDEDEDDNSTNETDSIILQKPGDPYKFAYNAWYQKGLLDWRPAESEEESDHDVEDDELVLLQEQQTIPNQTPFPEKQPQQLMDVGSHLSSQPSEESYGSTLSESKRATTPLQEARARAISYRRHTAASKSQEPKPKIIIQKTTKDALSTESSMDSQSAASSKTNSGSASKKKASASASSALSAYRNARRYHDLKSKESQNNNKSTGTDPMYFRDMDDSDDTEEKELQELLQLEQNLKKSDSCEQSRSSKSSDASFRKKYRDLLDNEPPAPMEPLKEDEPKVIETPVQNTGKLTMGQRARRAALKIKEAKSLAQRPSSRGATLSDRPLSPTNYRQLAHSPNVSLKEREMMKEKFISDAKKRLESQKAISREPASVGVEIALSSETSHDILDKLVESKSIVQSDLLMVSLRSEDLEAEDSIAATAQSAIAVLPRPMSAPPQSTNLLQSRSLETTAAQMDEAEAKKKQTTTNNEAFELSHTKVNEFVKVYDKTTAGNSVLDKYKKKKSQASFKDKSNLPEIKEGDIGVVIVNKFDDAMLPTEFSKEEDDKPRPKGSEGIPQNKGYCDDQCAIM